jgi:hypothetical protein
MVDKYICRKRKGGGPFIYCDRPHDDESLSSWLDRNVQRYGLTRQAAVRAVGARFERVWDFDAFDCWEARRPFFDATGLQWSDLAPFASPVPERDWLLHQSCRKHYCPRCFDEDLRQHRTPYFRLGWAHVLTTHCATHGTPLFEWKNTVNDGSRILPPVWIADPSPKHVDATGRLRSDLIAVDALIEGLSRHPQSMEVCDTLKLFERACLDYEPYRSSADTPKGAAEDLGTVCRALVLVLRRAGGPKEFHWIARDLCPDFFDRKYLSFNSNTLPRTTKQLAWRFGVRCLSDLPTRRAALWVVAHTFSRLSPKTKLRNGGYAPPGHCPGWLESMSGVIGSREQVKAALQNQPSCHLLEPRQYSSVDGPPPHYW